MKTHTENTMKKLGQVGYDAYGSAAAWKTFDGRAMPTWDQLGATEAGRVTQRRWELAALSVGISAIDGAIGERKARLAQPLWRAVTPSLWWWFLAAANAFLLGFHVSGPRTPTSLGFLYLALALVFVTAAAKLWSTKKRKAS